MAVRLLAGRGTIWRDPKHGAARAPGRRQLADAAAGRVGGKARWLDGTANEDATFR